MKNVADLKYLGLAVVSLLAYAFWADIRFFVEGTVNPIICNVGYCTACVLYYVACGLGICIALAIPLNLPWVLVCLVQESEDRSRKARIAARRARRKRVNGPP